jgi:hypothetical protein
VLAPLHNAIFLCLKKINEDYTYDQEASIPMIQKWYKEGKPMFCYDMTSATDRLPLSLQGVVLHLSGLSESCVNEWYEIIKSLPFRTPEGNIVYYGTGQGMGIYSSWRSITYLHHVLVRLAGYRCGHTHFKDYAVLGDDMIVANAQVAQEYLVLINILGVDISLSKSVVPTKGYSSAEFASKLVCNGINISPLPLGLLLMGDMQSFLQLCHTILIRLNDLEPVKGEHFRRLLEVMAPRELFPSSGSFSVGSLGLKGSTAFAIEDFLTILGSFLGLNLIKGFTKDTRGQYSDRGQVLKPLPLLGDDLRTYLDCSPLNY